MILQIKKYTIVILLLAIVITALILSLLTFFYDSINLSPGKNTFSPCEKITENAKRYSCYQNSALSSLQKNKDIKKLSAYALEFPYSRRHLMGHAIARAVLIVSGYNLEVTAEKCLPSCITGYWHGIAEEWGKHTPKRAQEFVNFLTKLCNNKQSEGVDCSGHSIGHLYISVNKNLDENLILCDNLDNDAMFPQCIMGVMHQYRIDGGAEDVFGICKNYTGRIKKACYEAGSFIYPRWRGGDTSTTRRLEYCKELNFNSYRVQSLLRWHWRFIFR